jgi:AAA+ ATPase superfamily predicted ATPase
MAFIGRKTELARLKKLQEKKIASFVVVHGRRRAGKSRLIQEFAKDNRFYTFTGIPPIKGVTSQNQRDEFMRQMGEQMRLPSLVINDWGDIFTLLTRQTEEGQVVILLDEISWMGSEDPTFLGKLKNAWDLGFSQNPNLMLIVCGSVSSWIEKNIISSTAFLGRPSLYMTVDELPLEDCNHFWGNYRHRISAYEKLKILSITAGVPRYLEMIDPKLSAEENIKEMCFLPDSFLVNEFERIFSDVFGKRSHIYREIITFLAQGISDQERIFKYFQKEKTGTFSEYLHDLILAGFLSRDYTWNIKTTKMSKLSHYRLKDNYTRFYLKCILPHKANIEKNAFELQSLSALKGWDQIIALQFENLVLNNQKKIIKLLNIPPEEIVFYNPYFQRSTHAHKGCQIDLLIQTKFNSLYICEIKFWKTQIGLSIIEEVQEKIDRLQIPKNFSYRPVLIHVNGVQEDVVDSGYFSSIVDFSELLGQP